MCKRYTCNVFLNIFSQNFRLEFQKRVGLAHLTLLNQLFTDRLHFNAASCCCLYNRWEKLSYNNLIAKQNLKDLYKNLIEQNLEND